MNRSKRGKEFLLSCIAKMPDIRLAKALIHFGMADAIQAWNDLISSFTSVRFLHFTKVISS